MLTQPVSGMDGDCSSPSVASLVLLFPKRRGDRIGPSCCVLGENSGMDGGGMLVVSVCSVICGRGWFCVLPVKRGSSVSAMIAARLDRSVDIARGSGGSASRCDCVFGDPALLLGLLGDCASVGEFGAERSPESIFSSVGDASFLFSNDCRDESSVCVCT